MSSQSLKSLRIRTRVQDSENHAHGSESPKVQLNKNRMQQENKTALTDLTNKKSANFKNMGNATDKETETGTNGKKANLKPQVGRQTRSKGKDVVLLNSAENQTKSIVKNASNTDKNPEVVMAVMNVGEDLINSEKSQLHPSRKTAKRCANSALHSAVISKRKPLKESLQSIQEKSAEFEEEDCVPKPNNSSKKVPSSSSDSEIEIPETTRSTRQTRNIGKLGNSANKPQSNLMSPKPTAKNAECKKTPARERSPDAVSSTVSTRKKTAAPEAVSPMLSNRKKTAAPDATKSIKPKRKNALERWIEEAGSAILPDGSPRICRKSSRLLSIQSNASSTSSKVSEKLKSPKSGLKSSKLMSPKSGLKSPGSATKTPNKVPVWRTEPKPDAIISCPNDVYGFAYDPSDCKPAKKKRIRKPKNVDSDVKPMKVKAAPKPTKRLQRTVVITENPKTPIKLKKKPTEDPCPLETTPLLKSVAEKLNNLTQSAIPEEPEKEDVISILNFSPIANYSPSVYDATLSDGMDQENYLDDNEKTTKSIVLAGDFENQTNMTNRYDQVEMDMEDLYGFGTEPENPPPIPTKPVEKKKLVKSTPIKERTTVADCFSSVSPVRKYAKATRNSSNRPARIDENVARHLICGIRPLQPVKDKQKSSTLLQYIQDVGDDAEEENNIVREKTVDCPSPVFTQPARRSYSKRDLRITKRKILASEPMDESASSDDQDEFAPKKSKTKKRVGKVVQKKNKREKEEEKWCEVMNSHFDDIDKFNLSS